MPDPICTAIEEQLIAGPLGDAHQEHVATCATCKGLIRMTGQIETELAEVPVQLGQVPQWIAAMHVSNTRRRRRIVWGGAFAAVAATVAIVVLSIGGLGGAAAKKRVLYQGAAPAPSTPTPTLTPTPAPTHTVVLPKPGFPQRPDWITSDELLTSYCTTTSGTLHCVGVSGYRASKVEAETEATEAAMEGLMVVVGDRIKSNFFMRYVRPAYDTARRRMIDAYTKRSTETDRYVPATDPAYRALASARHRALRALVRGGAAGMPAMRSDWYWEEFAKQNGPGTEFVGFVRYDINDEQLAKLVELYSIDGPAEPITVADAARSEKILVLAFPLLSFALDDFEGGFLSVVDMLAGKPLRKALR